MNYRNIIINMTERYFSAIVSRVLVIGVMYLAKIPDKLKGVFLFACFFLVLFCFCFGVFFFILSNFKFSV